MEIGNKNIAFSIVKNEQYYEHNSPLAICFRIGNRQIGVYVNPYRHGLLRGLLFEYWNINKSPIEPISTFVLTPEYRGYY